MNVAKLRGAHDLIVSSRRDPSLPLFYLDFLGFLGFCLLANGAVPFNAGFGSDTHFLSSADWTAYDRRRGEIGNSPTWRAKGDSKVQDFQGRRKTRTFVPSSMLSLTATAS